jgi:hypothetical protein
MKISNIIILGVLGISIAIVGGYALRYYTSPVRGSIEAYQQIQSGEMRISAYNHFFDLYAAIKSYETTLNALNDNLKQVTSDSEKERILATIAGLKGQRARAIAQYNVDARKSYTIGQFKDWSLPYQINEEGK